MKINDTIDLDALYKNFIAEVESVVASKSFLSGIENPEAISFEGSNIFINCKLCELSEFSAEHATDNGDYKSKFIALNEMILKVSTPLKMIQSYIAHEESRFIGSKVGAICDAISNSSKFKSIANMVFSQTPPNFDEVFASDFTHSTIATHFAGIIHARTLTLSKRHVRLEAVLEAYRIGLFPFGWDKREEELLCVNPIDI